MRAEDLKVGDIIEYTAQNVYRGLITKVVEVNSQSILFNHIHGIYDIALNDNIYANKGNKSFSSYSFLNQGFKLISRANPKKSHFPSWF